MKIRKAMRIARGASLAYFHPRRFAAVSYTHLDVYKRQPYEATKKAMSNLSGALIAMSLVLCAVFVPVSFHSGITGQLYRQFTCLLYTSVSTCR